MLHAVLAAVALSAVGPGVGAARSSTPPVWTAAWGTSLHASRDFGTDPWARAATPVGTVSDQTLRLIVHSSAGGSSVRVHLSNREGDRPVTFDRASIGRRLAGATVDPASLRALRFAGQAGVTLAPGAEVTSDPAPLAVADGDDLAVSVHVAGTTSLPAWHRFANTTSYLSAPGSGDHVTEPAGAAFVWPTTSWFWLDRIDVAGGQRRPVVVTLGDSITDGFPLTPDTQSPWPAALATRLDANGHPAAVVNAGIAGNRVVGPPCGQCGAPAIARLEHDALSVPGVSTVVVFEGTNDLAAGVAPYEIAKGLTALATRIRARGVRVVGATITPRGRSTGWTAELEHRRWEVNSWIMKGGAFDAVVDFDAALRDPLAHQNLRTEYDSGDGLHPNALGYAALADAVPVAFVAA
jgi:lysophospholipase L1-like esterase